LSRAFFNEKSNSLPDWLAFAVNRGAFEPFNNIIDWAKPRWVTKSKNPQIKRKGR
jgi:hypothetical protein